jgi:hypothetical protein
MRKRRQDDIVREICKGFLIVRLIGVTVINIKATVIPIEHVFDHQVVSRFLCKIIKGQFFKKWQVVTHFSYGV